MNLRFLMLPVVLAGGFMMGCDDKVASKSPDASTNAKASDAKADAVKAAADAKADANKTAADVKAAADKAAANAKADADRTAANVKTAADETAANAVRTQAAKMLVDLQTAVTGSKWTDAGALVKQLDAVRDKLAADQKVSFDSLKKQYDDNRREL